LRRQARAAQFVRSRDSSFALQLYAKFGRHLLLRRTESDMEKPTARGPVPSRKAHLVLGKRLNRKMKQPPPMPVKKNLTTARRISGG
jgi:hypothetical protein